MSQIRFYCAVCGAGLKISPEHAGGLAECIECRRIVPVPIADTEPGASAGCLPVLPPGVLSLDVTFSCGDCGTHLITDARWEGRKVGCPKCSARTPVPGSRWRRDVPAAAVLQPDTFLSVAEVEYLSAELDGPQSARRVS